MRGSKLIIVYLFIRISVRNLKNSFSFFKKMKKFEELNWVFAELFEFLKWESGHGLRAHVSGIYCKPHNTIYK